MSYIMKTFLVACLAGGLIAATAGSGRGAEPEAAAPAAPAVSVAPAAPVTTAAPKGTDAKIYGIAHISVDSISDGKDTSLYLSSNSSRLGFKGEKGISDVISAIWQVEAEVRFDERDENDYFATRETYAGLTSPAAGSIIAGRIDTPFKQLSRKSDLFGDRIGDSRNLVASGGAGWDQRPDNFVLASSRSLGGFIVQAGQKMGDGPDDTGMTSASVTYGGRAGFVGAAGERHGKWLTPVDSNKDGTNDAPSAADEVAVRLAGSLKVSRLTVNALYQYVHDVGGTAGAHSTTMGGGAAYALGAETLKAQCYVTDGGAASDVGSILSVVGVDHALSDKVTLYLAFARANNEAKAKFSMSGTGHGDKVTPAAGNDSDGVSLGLICKF